MDSRAAGGPGRACPVSYRYGAAALRRAPELRADTLWVAGGLYGNPFALEALLGLYAAERGSKALVFNGDFHWFDAEPSRFIDIESGVQAHARIRGNVETELADPADGAGCGCGYPDWVGEATVAHSNRIIERLKDAARRHPEALRRLAALPMHLVAEVGGERVAIVHGDADSLAGWAFSQEALAGAAGRAGAGRAFDEAGVRVFASSHTCLPVLQELPGGRFIANNGAAGMPNFEGTTFGLATRISTFASGNALYGARAGALHVEAIALRYDAKRWEEAFLALWPAGSDAHASYHGRIVHGPQYRLDQAQRRASARGTPVAA
jgi:hypothetical protein